jgi:hypothetical protein
VKGVSAADRRSQTQRSIPIVNEQRDISDDSHEQQRERKETKAGGRTDSANNWVLCENPPDDAHNIHQKPYDVTEPEQSGLKCDTELSLACLSLRYSRNY